jgi:hypothetical protein
VDRVNAGRCSVKRSTFKQTLQFSALVVGFALLPAPVEAIAQSDLLGPMIALVALCAAAAVGIFAWPVKR